MGKVRIVIIAALVALQAIFGIPAYLSSPENYWLKALSYSFFHANWWHLAVNCLAVWSIFAPPRKWTGTLPLAYLIAVLVYPLSFRPVIGFSNILYAMLGLRTPSLKSEWWRRTPVITFLAVTLALALVPRFSATTHIAAFALGMAGAALKRLYLELTKDARRYY